MVLRRYERNPIIRPNSDLREAATFNPAAIVRKNEVYLLYRSQEKWSGTSVIRLAKSKDGVNFVKMKNPVLVPELPWENPGGCEDPRVVEINGRYYMTYTAYNGKTARLALAISDDPMKWTKVGIVFPDWGWSKSGGIVPEKINGYYWMYFGDSYIWIAKSKDLIHWKTKRDWIVLKPRKNYFDSLLVEVGPPPIVRDDEIILIYNSADKQKVYRICWAIFSKEDPSKVIARGEVPILEPKTPWEVGFYEGKRIGQTPNVVFAESLVYFNHKWYLYYGASDTYVCLAIADKLEDFLI